MEAPSFVHNAMHLVEAMGHWPSFHDANVLSVESGADELRISIHVFAMTDRVDQAGYYVLEKHHLVTLKLQGVKRASFPEGYESDCLDHLIFARAQDAILVSFESHMDRGGQVLCSMAVVESVVPCSPLGEPLSA
jgi:hypothetical protein